MPVSSHDDSMARMSAAAHGRAATVVGRAGRAATGARCRVDLRAQPGDPFAHRGVGERLRGHDQRVLAVVAVVARPQPDRPEPELLVQPARRQVRQPDLERRLVRAAVRGQVEEREQQPLADVLAAPGGWTANVMMWPSSTISHIPP